jgi:hypothetical protein
VCNGTETQTTCCHDCGCPSGESCNGGACTCASATLHVINTMPDNANLCINLNEEYTQLSTAYLSTGGQHYYLPAGGYVDLTDAIGTTVSGTIQCCYRDGCVGNLSCTTPIGPEPCLCTATQSWSKKITQCGVTTVDACGN